VPCAFNIFFRSAACRKFASPFSFSITRYPYNPPLLLPPRALEAVFTFLTP